MAFIMANVDRGQLIAEIARRIDAGVDLSEKGKKS